MMRSPNKAASDSDLSKPETQPLAQPTYVTSRPKRKHDDISITKDDFLAFKNEIKQMLSSWNTEQDKKLKKMENSLLLIQNATNDCEKSLQFISQQYEDMRNNIRQLEQQCKNNCLTISSLEGKLEDLQLNTKKNNLEIRNLPSQEKESTAELIQMMLTLTSGLNHGLQPSDIRHIYRVPGKKGTNRPIIMELNTIAAKQDILNSVRRHNNSNPSQKLNTAHFGISGTANAVYIGEDLTSSTRKLFYLARELCKEKQYKFCWIAHGKVLIRKIEGQSAVLIKNEAQIEKLRQE
ncbi:hypothetical protein PYW08_006297 [Mythimna loreyi]|uniref:Uncharacterized protein n=1 Tax=Mythimna loreyi TaxID=667449 RepID=A0ACC2QPT0_9NEOP|nr:hypothetical protein PYW08_006297 [Mythimna loreyi]